MPKLTVEFPQNIPLKKACITVTFRCLLKCRFLASHYPRPIEADLEVKLGLYFTNNGIKAGKLLFKGNVKYEKFLSEGYEGERTKRIRPSNSVRYKVQTMND